MTASPGSIDPSRIQVVVATDCGSTTTKAILLERRDGADRQTHRGEAPTTVEEPLADVTLGVTNAVTELQELSGRTLVNADGTIRHRSGPDDPHGCDIYVSTSSAGGGLQMMVAGVVREMTAESAKRAALGAGAIVMDTIAGNDRRKPHEQIQRIRELRPDMVLVSGGTDGGDRRKVVEIAELIAPAKPRPRFGSEFRLPVIYAGNRDAAEAIRGVFG
ncbi:MAG: glutamate mutase L, partial [Phycisphaerales bacterium]